MVNIHTNVEKADDGDSQNDGGVIILLFSALDLFLASYFAN